MFSSLSPVAVVSRKLKSCGSEREAKPGSGSARVSEPPLEIASSPEYRIDSHLAEAQPWPAIHQLYIIRGGSKNGGSTYCRVVDLTKRSFGGIWYPNFVKPSKLLVSFELHPRSWKILWLLVGVAKQTTTKSATKSAWPQPKCVATCSEILPMNSGDPSSSKLDRMEIDGDPLMHWTARPAVRMPLHCPGFFYEACFEWPISYKENKRKQTFKSLSIQKSYEMLT